jgi:hypothetical protein
VVRYPRIPVPMLSELLCLPNSTPRTSSSSTILSSFAESTLALEESRRRMHLLQTQMESNQPDGTLGDSVTTRARTR